MKTWGGGGRLEQYCNLTGGKKAKHRLLSPLKWLFFFADVQVVLIFLQQHSQLFRLKMDLCSFINNPSITY